MSKKWKRDYLKRTEEVCHKIFSDLKGEKGGRKIISRFQGLADQIRKMLSSLEKGVADMPIYEYHCDRCDNEFEKLVFNTTDKITCPECKSKKVSRMMSSFAFSSGGKFKSTASSSCGSCAATSCSTCNK